MTSNQKLATFSFNTQIFNLMKYSIYINKKNTPCTHIVSLSLPSTISLIMSSNWKSSRSKSMKPGKNDYEYSYSWSSNHKWLTLWRRSKGKKNKKSSESPFATQKTYAPQSYMQNFDEGSDSDNLYRSFSARYANPSRFDPNELRRSSLIDV